MATCVVSGSASGIGAGTRERLERDGHRVIGIDLRDAEVEADLSMPEGRAAAIRATLEKCEGRIDRLVLSAGVGEMVPIHLVTSVNYFGSIVLLDAFQAAPVSRRKLRCRGALLEFRSHGTLRRFALRKSSSRSQ